MNKPNPIQPRMTSDMHRVGGGFSVQFSSHPDKSGIHCVWSPHLPSPGEIARKVDMAKYEAARDAFVVAVTATMQMEGRL